VAISGLLTWWSAAAGDRAAAQQLSDRGELLVFEAQDLLDDASKHISAVSALFGSSEVVTMEEFSTFVADIEVIPGFVGVGYVRVIGDEQINDWLAPGSAPPPGMRLFEYDEGGVAVPAQRRGLHYPVVYFGPAHQSIIGLDLSAESFPHEQLTANLGGGTTMTDFLGDAIPGPFGGPDHVLLGRAISHPGDGPMLDFIVAVLDVGELIRGNVADKISSDLVWSIADTADTADTTAVSVAFVESGDVWQGTMEFGGRTWLVSAWEGRSGEGLPGLAMVVLIAGLAISALLALVAFLVVSRLQARSEVLVLESISDGKDDFLAAVSHRLRTPLTSVVGFSEILRDSDARLSDSDRRELVATIAVQAIDLGHLFDNLLLVSRGVDRSPFIAAKVGLATETYAVLDTVESARRSKVRVVSADPDLVAAGDPSLVRQILRNLLSNAAEFGSEVEVEIVGRGLVASVIFRDNGPGVPPDRVGDVFELYGSRGSVGQPDSMGVGLYVSRRLARRMSGDISYSRSGGWTRFEFTLPAMPAEVVIEPFPDVARAVN
jgi:signal transduction histidine kinase